RAGGLRVCGRVDGGAGRAVVAGRDPGRNARRDRRTPADGRRAACLDHRGPRAGAEPDREADRGPADRGDLKAVRLTIGAPGGPACLCWAADGRAFYHLDGAGAALETGRKCAWLCVSAAGPVVTVADAQEA